MVKRNLITAGLLALGFPAIIHRTRDAEPMLSLGRAKTRDVAFQFRMGAGFPGDVNRTHPASIAPYLNDETDPVPFYGSAVLATTSNTVRGVKAADDAETTIFGVAVRPFPIQQASGSNYGEAGFGNSVPPLGALDVLKTGFIMVPVVGTPSLRSSVYVWIAASGGGHVQGGFEVAAGGAGDTIPVPNAYFNGPADANGVAELVLTRP